MTTHVFIVTEQTFPAHLEYMFAGTSSGKKEKNTALLTDIKRVRKGDEVIFYFERIGFYGIFKIKDDKTIDGKHKIYYDKDNYCNGRLGKKLLYRTLIEPDEVYAKPISEWDALEKLPDNPRDIIWSLIYRKLKGGRGCTPVTIKESEKLIALIKEANNGKKISDAKGYTWENDLIVPTNQTKTYDSSRAILPDFENDLYDHKKVEVWLQGFFTENVGVKKFDGSVFSEIVGKSNEIIWIGNEVFCGIGMQKIDVFTITKVQNELEYKVIELKTVIDQRFSDKIMGIHKQLERYVNWTLDYLSVNPKNLQPIVVIPKPTDKDKKTMDSAKELIKQFNNDFKQKCHKVKLFCFDFNQNKEAIFSELNY